MHRATLGAIEDVALGDLVILAAHQVFFDDVLDVLHIGIELDETLRDLLGSGRSRAVRTGSLGAVRKRKG